MVRRPRTAAIPMEFSVRLGDRPVINARVAAPHQAVLIELPVFVAVGAKPVARVVVVFVGKPNGDAVAGDGPVFLDQSVIEFALPFPREKGDDIGPTLKNFRAVTPLAIGRVGERYPPWVAGIPRILRR